MVDDVDIPLLCGLAFLADHVGCNEVSVVLFHRLCELATGRLGQILQIDSSLAIVV